MNFSIRLNELMVQKQITAYRLSKETGITERLIGYWKAGDKQPTMDNLVKLADYFDVSLDYLVGRVNLSLVTPPQGVVINKNVEENEKMSKKNFDVELIRRVTLDCINKIEKYHSDDGIIPMSVEKDSGIPIEKLVDFKDSNDLPTYVELSALKEYCTSIHQEIPEIDLALKNLFDCRIISKYPIDKFFAFHNSIEKGTAVNN